MSALDLDAVRKRLNAGLRAALTDDCAQVLTVGHERSEVSEAGLRMRELLWASSDAGWRELIAVLEADGKPEGAAVDYVRTLITRLRAAEARTAWQPIETAPRDGTLVLAWHPHWGGPDAVRCSSRGQWTADWLPTCAPTHWQPLPAAPEAP